VFDEGTSNLINEATLEFTTNESDVNFANTLSAAGINDLKAATLELITNELDVNFLDTLFAEETNDLLYI
jgi:hypothetical protein